MNSATFLAASDGVEPFFTGINKLGPFVAGNAAANPLLLPKGVSPLPGSGITAIVGVAGSGLAPGSIAATIPDAAGSCGTRAQFANGLYSGQYIAPVTDFIFAEKIQAGIPAASSNFWEVGFLFSGEAGRGGNSGGVQATQPW